MRYEKRFLFFSQTKKTESNFYVLATGILYVLERKKKVSFSFTIQSTNSFQSKQTDLEKKTNFYSERMPSCIKTTHRLRRRKLNKHANTSTHDTLGKKVIDECMYAKGNNIEIKYCRNEHR